MFCVVWYKSLTTFTLLVGDLNYHAGSHGPLSVVQFRPISYQNCQVFLNVTFFFFFFANLLGLGLTRILLPPFMLYL